MDRRSAGLGCLAFCMAAVSFIAASAASPPSDETKALAQLTDDLAECYAYYAITAQCVSADASAELKSGLNRSSQLVSSEIAQYGQRAGMKAEAALAEIDLMMKDQMDTIGKSCINYSILLDRYGASCKSISENPSAKLKQISQSYSQPGR